MTSIWAQTRTRVTKSIIKDDSHYCFHQNSATILKIQNMKRFSIFQIHIFSSGGNPLSVQGGDRGFLSKLPCGEVPNMIGRGILPFHPLSVQLGRVTENSLFG